LQSLAAIRLFPFTPWFSVSGNGTGRGVFICAKGPDAVRAGVFLCGAHAML
jgi:hypothetical protein